MEKSPECGDSERCLKEINPKCFPGVYWGKPFVWDMSRGCCVDCAVERRMKVTIETSAPFGEGE